MVYLQEVEISKGRVDVKVSNGVVVWKDPDPEKVTL